MLSTQTICFTLTALQAAQLRHTLSHQVGSPDTGRFSLALDTKLRGAALLEAPCEAPTPDTMITRSSDPMQILSGLMGMASALQGPQAKDLPENAPDESFKLDLTEAEANEITGVLRQKLGMVFTQEIEPSDAPDLAAAKLLSTALDGAWPHRQNRFAFGPAATPQTPSSTPVEGALNEISSDVLIGIASEADGDIAGYFLFDTATLSALDAYPGDAWAFVTNGGADAPKCFDTLPAALTDIQQRPPLEPPGFSPRRKAARFFPVLVCRK